MNRNTNLPAFEQAEITVDGDTLIIDHVQDAERGAFAAGLLAADTWDGYTESSGGHVTPADSFPQ